MMLDASERFAGHFDLTAPEAEALTHIAGELAELLPSFVHKRERGLWHTFPITLSLLRDEACAVVEDYSDACAPLTSATAENLRFADFLVARTRDMADRLLHGQIIVEIARFERVRCRVFCTERPLRPGADEDCCDLCQINRGSPLWLDRSAAVERFGWDIRAVRSPHSLPGLRPDPACLLFFQRVADGEVEVMRITDEWAGAIELIACKPGEMSTAKIERLIGSTAPVDAALGKLLRRGVIKAARQ